MKTRKTKRVAAIAMIAMMTLMAAQQAGASLMPPPGPRGVPEDPGFSFFPPWLGTTVMKHVRSSAWLLYLIALVLAAIALILWIRSNPAKSQRSEVSPDRKAEV